jgi:hypothetical protein
MIADILKLNMHEFYDYFERTSVGPLWDDSEVASASISSGQLVVTPLSYSWASWNGVIYVGDLNFSGDFEVEGAFDYVSGGSRDLGVVGIALLDSQYENGVSINMRDAWADHTGCLSVRTIDPINGETEVYTTNYGTRPASGSATYKIVREGGTISFYEGGTYRYEYTDQTNFMKLKLVNYAYNNYAYKTAYWDYIKVRRGG